MHCMQFICLQSSLSAHLTDNRVTEMGQYSVTFCKVISFWLASTRDGNLSASTGFFSPKLTFHMNKTFQNS